ncbi:hypothetical protein WJX84_001893, partial [Apatococcus fuscideae]
MSDDDDDEVHGDASSDEELDQADDLRRERENQAKHSECSDGGSGSALPPGKRRLQDSGSDSDDEDRAASSGSQPSAGELHAETQRVLRDSARGDALGKGQLPSALPLSSVLEKIKHRAAAAAAAAAATSCRRIRHSLSHRPEAQPPGAQRQSIQNPAAPVATDGLDDMVLLSDDDEAGPAAPAAALPFPDTSMPASQDPMADFAEPGSHNASEDIRMGTSPDSLDLQLEGSEEPASELTSPAKAGGNVSAAHMDPDQEAASSDDEHTPGSDSEEEMEAASDSSSSSSDDDEDQPEVGTAERAQRLAQARRLLLDQPRSKRKHNLFEDEAEMSEDEGHSDSGSDHDDHDHDNVLRDLLGDETE